MLIWPLVATVLASSKPGSMLPPHDATEEWVSASEGVMRLQSRPAGKAVQVGCSGAGDDPWWSRQKRRQMLAKPDGPPIILPGRALGPAPFG